MAEVAVIIAVYNGESFVDGAIESAMEQTIPVEVLVVDDGSTDQTVAVAEDAAGGDPRVQVVRQPVNGGPSVARNRALDMASAEWVTVLDADDRMAPDRLERLTQKAAAGNWDMFADDLMRVTDWSRLSDYRRHWRDDPIGEMAVDFETFWRENDFHHTGHHREMGFLKPVMRRATLNGAGIRYREDMRLGEDADLYGRALLSGMRFAVTDPCGYYAYDRPGSLSKAHRAGVLEYTYRAAAELMNDPRIPSGGRSALKAYRDIQHRKWAWIRLIEAVGNRDIKSAALSFMAPPHVQGHLTQGITEHFFDPDHPRRKRRISTP